jgi:hypothetical protein
MQSLFDAAAGLSADQLEQLAELAALSEADLAALLEASQRSPEELQARARRPAAALDGGPIFLFSSLVRTQA